MKDAAGAVQKILGEADALIRRRLKAAGLEAHHVILALRPDGIGIVRSNVSPGSMAEMAEMLKEIADQSEAPPADDDTRH